MVHIKKTIVRTFKSLLKPLGYELHWIKDKEEKYPPDYSLENISIIKQVIDSTMTSPTRVNTLIDAVKYISGNNINGAIVECGVWKGGSIMAAALTLNLLDDHSREIYLYDTFSGMSQPGTHEIRSSLGNSIENKYQESKISDDYSTWCYSPIEEVKSNVFSTNYPQHLFKFVEGKVEDTIPQVMPDSIAILRLDTDWYESTKHELKHLYPLLVKNGILIIDDYGHWEGAKQAVDEYIKENNLRLFLNRIDYSCRLMIKN